MHSTNAGGLVPPSPPERLESPALARQRAVRRPRRARERIFGLVLIAAMSACTGLLGLDGLELVRTRPGKPGLDLTAGGNVSTSPKYRLVGALGESPGGNVVGRSASYTLYGGLVATVP
jgi:hypothetical protein